MSSRSSSDELVYVVDGFSEPMVAQHNFVNNFDLSDPEQAKSEYQRIMHEHTKRQLNTVSMSVRRKSAASSSDSSVGSS